MVWVLPVPLVLLINLVVAMEENMSALIGILEKYRDTEEGVSNEGN
nr:MAG TPA_asm: hypothetical protein [Caudoviricetes sp.]